MALVCHMSRWLELGVLHLTQTKLRGRGRSVRWVEKEGRKERKERKKENKKRRKEEEMKEKRRSWSAPQHVGSSPTWDTLV